MYFGSFCSHIMWWSILLKAHLVPICFHFFSPKSSFEKSQCPKPVWVTFWKSCFLDLWRERVGWERSSEVHFGKSLCALNQISVGLCEQLPNYPSINQKMSSSSSFDAHKHPHRRTEHARAPPLKCKSHHPPNTVQPSPPPSLVKPPAPPPKLVKTTETQNTTKIKHDLPKIHKK